MQERIGFVSAQSFRLKHRALLSFGEATQLQDDGISVLFEIGMQRGEVSDAKPIGYAAGNPDFVGTGREQLLDQGVDSVPVTASAALLIQPIDE